MDAFPPCQESSVSPPWWRIALVGRRPKRTLVRIVVLVAACFLLRAYVVLPVRVDGISMMPTYSEHGINLVNRLAYLFHEPQRGDVVAIRLAGEHIMYLKRIVGLPGETVEFHRGKLVINGQPVDERYLKYPCDWDTAPEVVEPGKYYVVGDNRRMPPYDHKHGQAQRDRIVGKVLL